LLGQSSKLPLVVFGGVILGCAIAVVVHVLLNQYPREDTEHYVPPEISISDTPEVYDANTLNTIVASEDVQSPTDLIRQILPSIDQLDQEALEELFNSVLQPNENSRNNTIARLVIDRLTELDPSSAFQLVDRLDYFKREWLIPVVMARWGSVNVADAIAATATLSTDLKKSAIRSILANSPALDNQLLLDLATTLDMDAVVKQVLSELQVQKMLDKPKQAFEFLFSDDVPDQDQYDLFNELAEDWLRRGGIDAFSGIFEILRTNEPGVSSDWSNYYDFARQMCDVDVELVWELLQTEYQDIRDTTLRKSVLAHWMQEDTDAAIVAVKELETKAPVDELYRDVIRWWASENPHHALQNVEKVPQGLRNHLYSQTIFSLSLKGEIDKALQVLEQMEALEVSTGEAQNYLIMGWTNHDMSAAMDWVMTNTEEGSELRNTLLRRNIDDLARLDPIKALRLAVENADPEAANASYSLPAQVIYTVATWVDIDQAIELLQRRSDSTNPNEYSAVGSELVLIGREAEAIQIGAQLSDDMQPEYFRNITWRWYLHDPEVLIDSLPKLPNERVQLAVAQEILRGNSSIPLLSAEEIAYLEDFVGEEETE